MMETGQNDLLLCNSCIFSTADKQSCALLITLLSLFLLLSLFARQADVTILLYLLYFLYFMYIIEWL